MSEGKAYDFDNLWLIIINKVVNERVLIWYGVDKDCDGWNREVATSRRYLLQIFSESRVFDLSESYIAARFTSQSISNWWWTHYGMTRLWTERGPANLSVYVSWRTGKVCVLCSIGHYLQFFFKYRLSSLFSNPPSFFLNNGPIDTAFPKLLKQFSPWET